MGYSSAIFFQSITLKTMILLNSHVDLIIIFPSGYENQRFEPYLVVFALMEVDVVQ
jgi:hypothetical protein